MSFTGLLHAGQLSKKLQTATSNIKRRAALQHIATDCYTVSENMLHTFGKCKLCTFRYKHEIWHIDSGHQYEHFQV